MGILYNIYPACEEDIGEPEIGCHMLMRQSFDRTGPHNTAYSVFVLLDLIEAELAKTRRKMVKYLKELGFIRAATKTCR